MHTPLRLLLKDKGSVVHSVEPTTMVSEVVKTLNEKAVGAVLVMQDEQLVGIFTERDLLRRVIGAGKDPRTVQVSDVMTRELAVVRPDLTVQDAMTVITMKHCRHLPVVEEGRVIGVVSSGDLTYWLIRAREVHIQNLVDFITGKYPA